MVNLRRTLSALLLLGTGAALDVYLFGVDASVDPVKARGTSHALILVAVFVAMMLGSAIGHQARDRHLRTELLYITGGLTIAGIGMGLNSIALFLRHPRAGLELGTTLLYLIGILLLALLAYAQWNYASHQAKLAAMP